MTSPRWTPGDIVPVEEPRRASPIDPRVPIIANMAAIIYAEKVIYNSNKESRRLSVDEAFLLYGEVAIRLAENDR